MLFLRKIGIEIPKKFRFLWEFLQNMPSSSREKQSLEIYALKSYQLVIVALLKTAAPVFSLIMLGIDLQRLPVQVRDAVDALQTATEKCTSFRLNVCISYGARAEIVNACKTVSSLITEGKLSVDNLDEQIFGSFLSTGSESGKLIYIYH